MIDHRPVGGGIGFRALIKAMVEDRFDGSIRARSYFESAITRCFQALDAVPLAESDNAQACPEALLGMALVFKNQLTEKSGARPDRLGFRLDSAWRPPSISSMA